MKEFRGGGGFIDIENSPQEKLLVEQLTLLQLQVESSFFSKQVKVMLPLDRTQASACNSHTFPGEQLPCIFHPLLSELKIKT